MPSGVSTAVQPFFTTDVQLYTAPAPAQVPWAHHALRIVLSMLFVITCWIIELSKLSRANARLSLEVAQLRSNLAWLECPEVDEQTLTSFYTIENFDSPDILLGMFIWAERNRRHASELAVYEHLEAQKLDRCVTKFLLIQGVVFALCMATRVPA